MRKVALALLLAGCAASTPPPATPPPSPPRPATAPVPPPPAAATPGVLPRAALDRVLSESPGAFLAHLDVEPRLSGGRFAGWRLRAFFPGDPRFAGVDLRAGDVVVAVNGNSLERPEQLADLWRELRGASELVVDLERDGRPVRLRFTITDGPGTMQFGEPSGARRGASSEAVPRRMPVP